MLINLATLEEKRKTQSLALTTCPNFCTTKVYEPSSIFVHIQLGLKRPEYVLRDITPKNRASSNSFSINSLIKLYLML